jgi:hypothetical protein
LGIAKGKIFYPHSLSATKAPFLMFFIWTFRQNLKHFDIQSHSYCSHSARFRQHIQGLLGIPLIDCVKRTPSYILRRCLKGYLTSFAVVKAFAGKYSIAPARLSGHGVGPLCPVSSNTNEDGRKLNRRVELVVK